MSWMRKLGGGEELPITRMARQTREAAGKAWDVATSGPSERELAESAPEEEVDERYLDRIGYADQPRVDRPDHDDGFLEGKEDDERKEPTWADRAAELGWRVGVNSVGLIRPDLKDAVERYNHFLDGTGEPLFFDLSDFFDSDPAGKAFERDTTAAMIERASALGDGPVALEMNVDGPRPATENWTKAIGLHQMFVSAQGGLYRTEEGLVLDMSITFYMEDRYNFNPGQHDIELGIADAANGRFEETGQGKQFTQYGQTTRRINQVVRKRRGGAAPDTTLPTR